MKQRLANQRAYTGKGVADAGFAAYAGVCEKEGLVYLLSLPAGTRVSKEDLAQTAVEQSVWAVPVANLRSTHACEYFHRGVELSSECYESVRGSRGHGKRYTGVIGPDRSERAAA